MDYNIDTGDFRFVWDENKNQTNIVKHNISFEEARTVFKDDCALVDFDPDHSESEDRFIIIGASNIGNLLTVCHCEREGGVIRLISARRATKAEEKRYHDGM